MDKNKRLPCTIHVQEQAKNGKNMAIGRENVPDPSGAISGSLVVEKWVVGEKNKSGGKK